jgi:hypothetical protein
LNRVLKFQKGEAMTENKLEKGGALTRLWERAVSARPSLEGNVGAQNVDRGELYLEVGKPGTGIGVLQQHDGTFRVKCEDGQVLKNADSYDTLAVIKNFAAKHNL